MKDTDKRDGNAGRGAVPLYRTMVEALRDEILEGRYQKTFPSEAQLVRCFAVGRQTVIRAMVELVNEGLVERRRGSGTVVSRRIRQKLGTVGLIMPNLASSPFTAAIAAVCRDVGFSLMFKELVDVHHLATLEKRAKMALSLAMELANAEVAGVLMEPVHNVAGFERINREMLVAFKKRRIPLVLVDHDICFRKWL